MEGIYSGIVRQNSRDQERVNPRELEKNTSFVPFSRMDTISWGHLEFLHILREDITNFLWKDEENLVDIGCYISHDGRWALIVDNGPGSLDTMVAKCSDHLLLLNIEADSAASISVSHLKNLRSLRIYSTTVYGSANMFEASVQGLQDLHKLEHLSLTDIQFTEDLDVSRLPGLISLQLDNTQLPVKCGSVTGIQRLRHLQHLHLTAVDWDCHLDISGMPDLKSIMLNMNSYTDRGCITGLQHHPVLEILHLSGKWTGPVPDVSGLKNLRQLRLSSNHSLCQVEGLSQLEALESLDLSDTGIRTIPAGIRALKNLTWLDLSDLELDELPDWLPELGLEFSGNSYTRRILLYNTKVQNVDMSIFDQPQEVILQWFAERNKVPLNEVKVVFLGDGEAGKTHTIARLLKDGEKPTAADFDGAATPGIVIRDKEYQLDGKKIQVHFWDFGGQEILHSMHRMFLTERTLYVVIINARDDTQDARARYWLHNLRTFAGSAPVLLVLNKIDQNPNASINRPNLEQMYGGLKAVIRMSALEDSPEQFNRAFTDALLRQVQAVGTLGTLWPRSWLALKSGLEKMETHYIHGNDYEDLCDDCGVEKNREELLHWFNDLGVSFCYSGSARLEDYVILRPEWITNAIYIMLFNRSEDTVNGVIPHSAIHRMLCPRRDQRDRIRRVLPDVTYSIAEMDYVMDVVRKFRLSYAISETEEFIPALCQRESMAVAAEYAADPDTLEFRMNYEYLPDNVIHRLMVEMRRDLDTRNVWRTGARFVQQGTGLSAVVCSDGEVLRLFVRSENPMHRPNTYLHILKGNIDQINADMKLQRPYCEVIYKADGIAEAFNYEDLINALEDGETTYRSPKRRRRILIQDILNQSGRTAEVELDRLRADIITACMQLQGNSKFWDATEDEWNTAVRDALRNMKYLVNDQTFQGISVGEKKAGELDLEIRKDPNIPWTICEALKIGDKGKAKWNAHLQKLLDNYNPSGLNYLFLLTYVDCDKDQFQPIFSSFSEHIKWYDPGKYERLSSSFSHIRLMAHNDPNYIRALRCTYDRAGSPTTVCHIFARMGR